MFDVRSSVRPPPCVTTGRLPVTLSFCRLAGFSKFFIMRSDTIKKGFERAPHRSLLRATGSIESEADWDKPFIAICNSYTDCIPGHAHLNEIGSLVKRRVREDGGVPFIFNN